MPAIFWLSACIGYCLWAAKGRRGTFLQGFLHGFFLGLLCFGYAVALLSGHLGGANDLARAVAAVCGAAAGVWLEGKAGSVFFLLVSLLFGILTASWFWQWGRETGFSIFWAFLGGTGLYAACCGVLPDGGAWEKLRPAAGGGMGFLFSAIIFSAMGIF